MKYSIASISLVVVISTASAAAVSSCGDGYDKMIGEVDSEFGQQSISLNTSFYYLIEDDSTELLITNVECDCSKLNDWFGTIDAFPQYNIVLWLDSLAPGEYGLEQGEGGEDFIFSGELNFLEQDSYYRWYGLDQGHLLVNSEGGEDYSINADLVFSDSDGRLAVVSGAINTRFCEVEW